MCLNSVFITVAIFGAIINRQTLKVEILQLITSRLRAVHHACLFTRRRELNVMQALIILLEI